MGHPFTQLAPNLAGNRRIVQIGIHEQIIFPRFNYRYLNAFYARLLHQCHFLNTFSNGENPLLYFGLFSHPYFFNFKNLLSQHAKASLFSSVCGTHRFSDFSKLVFYQRNRLHGIVIRKIILSHNTGFITGYAFIKVNYTVYIIVTAYQPSLLGDVAESHAWNPAYSKLLYYVYEIHMVISPCIDGNDSRIRPHHFGNIAGSLCRINFVITHFRNAIHNDSGKFNIRILCQCRCQRTAKMMQCCHFNTWSQAHSLVLQ